VSVHVNSGLGATNHIVGDKRQTLTLAAPRRLAECQEGLENVWRMHHHEALLKKALVGAVQWEATQAELGQIHVRPPQGDGSLIATLASQLIAIRDSGLKWIYSPGLIAPQVKYSERERERGLGGLPPGGGGKAPAFRTIAAKVRGRGTGLTA
jgi:hypothetical protein